MNRGSTKSINKAEAASLEKYLTTVLQGSVAKVWSKVTKHLDQIFMKNVNKSISVFQFMVKTFRFVSFWAVPNIYLYLRLVDVFLMMRNSGVKTLSESIISAKYSFKTLSLCVDCIRLNASEDYKPLHRLRGELRVSQVTCGKAIRHWITWLSLSICLPYLLTVSSCKTLLVMTPLQRARQKCARNKGFNILRLYLQFICKAVFCF